MILLMDSKFQKPMNIGNPNEFSILEIANIIKDLINPELKFDYKALSKMILNRGTLNSIS